MNVVLKNVKKESYIISNAKCYDIFLRLKKIIFIEQTINYYIDIKNKWDRKIKINIKIFRG